MVLLDSTGDVSLADSADVDHSCTAGVVCSNVVCFGRAHLSRADDLLLGSPLEQYAAMLTRSRTR